MNWIHIALEWLNYLSGIAVAIIAGIGLRQLTIAKETARTNSKREAFRLAADQCAFYLQHIIPLQNELDKQIEEKKVQFFEKAKITIDEQGIRMESTATKEDFEALIVIAESSLPVYNAMEAFALFFTSGVADERAAFSTVGTTFCHSVRGYLPDLMVSGGGDNYCKNLLRLFYMWNSRIEAQKLAKERESIDAKMGKMNKTFIRPIGT